MKDDQTLTHEQVEVVRGPRSGAAIIVALHSTALGPALGGCRLQVYRHWLDGLADALRLSEAMTYKTSLAGLDHGGGKMVIVRSDAAPKPSVPDLLHDAGDVVQSLGGRYITGPDIGTGPTDMELIGQRTRHVFCRPETHGGSGDSSGDTATGARVTVSDTDLEKRAVAERLGCRWVRPDQVLTTPTDVLVPAGPGGLITADVVGQLRCSAIVGPANNQLATDAVADLLHEVGIVWAPDYLVSAGGVIGATARELHRASAQAAEDQVRRIGPTLTSILRQSAAAERPPHRAALGLARSRLTAAAAG